jgi:hypothetical protein
MTTPEGTTQAWHIEVTGTPAVVIVPASTEDEARRQAARYIAGKRLRRDVTVIASEPTVITGARLSLVVPGWEAAE